jgi:hypothetical protein
MDRRSFRLGDGVDGDADLRGQLHALAAERRRFGWTSWRTGSAMAGGSGSWQ